MRKPGSSLCDPRLILALNLYQMGCMYSIRYIIMNPAKDEDEASYP